MKVRHSRRTHKNPFKLILIAVLDRGGGGWDLCLIVFCSLHFSPPRIQGKTGKHISTTSLNHGRRSKSTNNHLIAFSVPAWVTVVTPRWPAKVLAINSNYCSKVKGWAELYPAGMRRTRGMLGMWGAQDVRHTKEQWRSQSVLGIKF